MSSRVLKATATFSFDRYLMGKFDSLSVARGRSNNITYGNGKINRLDGAGSSDEILENAGRYNDENLRLSAEEAGYDVSLIIQLTFLKGCIPPDNKCTE